jgi:hypothetical protein
MARFLGGGDDGDARNANDDGDSALRPCGQPHTALLLLSELVEPKAQSKDPRDEGEGGNSDAGLNPAGEFLAEHLSAWPRRAQQPLKAPRGP